ncbi:hypothetical protein A0H81_05040 [Grifola frondosa]|uniref:Protein kinase domain-containing protein n=1 Tax=Grifola frondosa TaxID=5627 RepID=A0A1C7MBK0_GRIFR|nr:hypothetical protein A0H81_05040 [Grifola frondosa]
MDTSGKSGKSPVTPKSNVPVMHPLSSHSSASSSTAKVSSPLNPSATPPKHTSSLSSADASTDSLAASSSPAPHSHPSSISRPRGESVSTIRPPSAPPSTAPPVTRVVSNPLPPTVVSAAASRDPDSQFFGTRTRSRAASDAQRGRSKSPLRDFAFTWRSTSRDIPTPPHGAPVKWWNARELARPWEERRQRTIPHEHTEGWIQLHQRVSEAAVNVLGTSGDVLHEVLLVSADVLRFVPILGLEEAARTLLGIWDSLQMVDINRLACLRLTERCATILMSVREEIANASDEVGVELQMPISVLVEAFSEVHRFLQKQIHRPFIKRYLRRDEVQRAIQACDNRLNDALGMFSLSIQIRILKQVLRAEEQRHADNAALLDRLSAHPASTQALPAPAVLDTNMLMLTGTDDALLAPIHVDGLTNPQQIRETLQVLTEKQNERDMAHDTADLRQLMRAALQANNDVEMLRVLQVGRDEMPEAMKTLQRALETEVERESIADEAASVASLGQDSERSRTSSGDSRASNGSARSRAPRDTLDREFIETGIDALRRLSGTEVALPSWTITRYEVDREEKIGIGFFSDVYRGTWRNRAVAIKVLAPTTPRQLFVHEVSIWKTLQHANVLELLGASSASSDPPWFFVSPHYKNGSLVTYLKGLPSLDSVDLLKMVHEIAKGMAYLHGKEVLHGDLKAANVLVDDRVHCIISDFGQSEMKSEAYRISGTPLPHGTLRWQAPELMAGQSEMTQQIDVYAFAICCVELLTKGAVPWSMADDDAVRHFVLKENMRPEIPLVRVWSLRLADIIHACWDREPSARPTFLKIDHEVQQLRVYVGANMKESPAPPKRQELQSTRKSPDMHPIPLPPLPHISTLPDGQSVLHQPFGPDHFIHSPIASSRESSRPASTIDSHMERLDLPGYQSPLPTDKLSAEYRNERRYRMLLQHEFHPSLTLPLWTPSQVALGAVGYHSKPSGQFVTLFNSFDPAKTSAGMTGDLPSLYGYGLVSKGNQRQDRRTVTQRGKDMIQSWIMSRSRNDASRNISRRYSSQLRAGHKTAHLFTESTVYRYIEDLSTPKKWFKANVDHIMELFGAMHQLRREDIYLVIGTLEAQNHALFVSHAHPDGHVHFDVFSSSKNGPFYAEEPDANAQYATKVSVSGNGKPDTVLIGRLRFKTDSPEPTSQV